MNRSTIRGGRRRPRGKEQEARWKGRTEKLGEERSRETRDDGGGEFKQTYGRDMRRNLHDEVGEESDEECTRDQYELGGREETMEMDGTMEWAVDESRIRICGCGISGWMVYTLPARPLSFVCRKGIVPVSRLADLFAVEGLVRANWAAPYTDAAASVLLRLVFGASGLVGPRRRPFAEGERRCAVGLVAFGDAGESRPPCAEGDLLCTGEPFAADAVNGEVGEVSHDFWSNNDLCTVEPVFTPLDFTVLPLRRACGAERGPFDEAELEDEEEVSFASSA
jgi:hypothetical protein